ncbi:MAG: tRNA pseudouridine(55) synthase TruB [Candidatus Paceibacterota bacterium]
MNEHILLIDKPLGITSFDVIRRLRRKLGIRKMGHAGTLDPLASGLMIIGVGEGTKQLTDYVKLDKEYLAEILVGERRSTGDMEGAVLEEKAVTALDEATVHRVLKEMTGTLTLPVSAYSAIKKDGVPMYKRARAAEKRGDTVTDVPIREMVVHEAELLGISTVSKRVVVRVRFAVGSGTYIRSLAEEFGKRLGYPATLKSLHRTKVGEFRIEDAEVM